MKQINICEEIGQNFIDSAYDTNTNRAFPDARDGLKPGMRCILWEMYKRGYTSKKPHVKSAKIDGGVAANWWPHGTVAIYETFARMSQPFTNNNPEIDFHGANGNVIMGGDAIAADRYTEARLAPITEDGMLAGVNKDTVDMTLNFSEDEEMPTVLPAMFPRLLVNGSQGIGVSVANYWTLHNLQETADIIINYMKNGTVDNDNYYPDYPTGGIIINQNDLPQINKTGKGKVIIEAKYTINGREINFTEFPYQVYIEPLIEEIKKGIDEDKIHSVREVANKSDKNRTLLSILCVTANSVDRVLEELFQYTSLRTQYNINQMAIVSKTPTLLTLEDICKIYVEFNTQCIKREHLFDLNKTKDRIEILEGLERAYNGLDNVINLIRNSKSAQDAKDYMIKNLNLTERQADAILALKLSRLAHLEKQQILDELEEKRKLAKELEEIVGSENRQKEILITRLTNLVKKYGTPRRTQIIQKTITKRTAAKTKKQVIAEDVIIALDKNGYMKSIPVAKFKSSSNNIQEVKAKTDSILNLFSSDGYCYRLKASAIKSCLNSDKGTALGSILQLNPQAQIKVFSVCGQEVRVFFATKLGKVKILDSRDMDGTTQNLRGMSVIKLAADDSLVEVAEVQDNHYVSLYTKDRGLVFDIAEINLSGKASSGRKGISLTKDEYVTKAKLLKENKSNGAFTLPIKHIGTRGTPWTSN